MLSSLAMQRLAVMCALAACSAGPQRIGEEPSWRGGGAARVTGPAGPVTFAPATASVTRYNEPFGAPPSSPLNDAVIAAVREAAAKAGGPVPVPDARLFRACNELAQVVPEEGVIGYALVEFALQHNGIIEPSPHLLVVWGNVDSPKLIVDELQPRLAEILGDGANARLGVGAARRAADGTGAVVFALQASGVTTQPIPRAVPAGARVPIDAVVDARYHDPELFVTREDGATERLELKPGRPGGFAAQVACGAHRGRQQVEITASDAAGSTVLANFPVWCGAEPPTSVTIDPAHDDVAAASTGDAEQRLFASVNRDRVAARLAPLAWDDQLAAVARGHSEDMRRTKIVAHISPTTGSAADRVRVAKIRTAVVLENVARAYGVNEAHAGLMNSPGHRANLMSPVATNIGIGVAFGEEISGRREMFVTQVFSRVPPAIDAAAAAEAVRRKAALARPQIAYAPKLATLAAQLATQLAAGSTREAAYASVKSQIDSLSAQYFRVGSVITATADIDNLDAPGLIGDIKADDLGVGIAQGPHPEIGERAVWVVVLFAMKRSGVRPPVTQP